MKKEEAFTRLNNAKLNQQWRHNLRQIKCKELKDEMMVSSSSLLYIPHIVTEICKHAICFIIIFMRINRKSCVFFFRTQTMENRFEILLDCKNNHIDMLLKDLEDAEEQNLKQYGAHAEIISQFLCRYQPCVFSTLY